MEQIEKALHKMSSSIDKMNLLQTKSTLNWINLMPCPYYKEFLLQKYQEKIMEL